MPVFMRPCLRPTLMLGVTLLGVTLLSGVVGCRSASSRTMRDQDAIASVLASSQPRDSAATRLDAVPWQSLFDGNTLTGWHGFKTPGKVPAGWHVVDGAITRVADAGDLVTDRTFANFELSIDWQIAEKGNSGVLYHIDPTADVTYQSAPEMQVLDDAGHADGASPLTSAGSAYGLYPPIAGAVKPAGAWNVARLLVNGTHVEHWLNGIKVVEYELYSPDWESRVRASKFAAWAGYGRAPRGYIGLQDHGDRVAYRNIRIRELP